MENKKVANVYHAFHGIKLALRGRIGLRADLIDYEHSWLYRQGAGIEHLEELFRQGNFVGICMDAYRKDKWKELGRVCLAQGDSDAAAAAWQKGIEVARTNGDKQAEKEMTVFLRRELKSQSGN